MTNQDGSILALDIGEKRVGLSLASYAAKLPAPLATLLRDENFLENLQQVIADNKVAEIVVGWPRGLSGQHTAQTSAAEVFTNELREIIDLQFHFQDEAVTSRQAEAELEMRGKPYAKGDIDALAATYILEDYLRGLN